MSDRDRYNMLLDTLKSDTNEERPSQLEERKDTTALLDDRTDFDRMTEDDQSMISASLAAKLSEIKKPHYHEEVAAHEQEETINSVLIEEINKINQSLSKINQCMNVSIY